MRRLRHLAYTVAFLGVLAGGVILGNRSLGSAALLAAIGLTASSSLSSTLQCWISGIAIRGEGYIEDGAICTIGGPAGPITVQVVDRRSRVTEFRDQAGDRLVLPNATLTTTPILVLADWPAPPPTT